MNTESKYCQCTEEPCWAVGGYCVTCNKPVEGKIINDFDQYIGETRDQFVLAVLKCAPHETEKTEDHIKLRVESENILIAYDQMREKLKHVTSEEIQRLAVLCQNRNQQISNYIIQISEKEDQLTRVLKELNDLKALINNPELNDFIEGFKIESAHQTERWTLSEEEKKPPHHYVMVMAKLLGKLTVAVWDYDTDKFKHHCITIAASLYNCHRQIEKKGTFVHQWFHKAAYSK